MARYTGPKNRLSRREGLDLFGRGNKLRRASQRPGQHGPKGTRRSSDYAVQLREKQKIKAMYGIMERQFRKYFEIATQVRGQTGEALLRLLETRLDNVIYRLGFVPTRAMSRQLVSHGHVQVNGRLVTLPSYQTRPEDVITLSAKAAGIPAIRLRLENSDIHPPAWLAKSALAGKIIRQPVHSDIDSPVDEQLIVEFYSR